MVLSTVIILRYFKAICLAACAVILKYQNNDVFRLENAYFSEKMTGWLYSLNKFGENYWKLTGWLCYPEIDLTDQS